MVCGKSNTTSKRQHPWVALRTSVRGCLQMQTEGWLWHCRRKTAVQRSSWCWGGGLPSSGSRPYQAGRAEGRVCQATAEPTSEAEGGTWDVTGTRLTQLTAVAQGSEVFTLTFLSRSAAFTSSGRLGFTHPLLKLIQATSYKCSFKLLLLFLFLKSKTVLLRALLERKSNPFK